MTKFMFDNGVHVVMTPYTDNLGTDWEESVVCYPVLGQWDLVVGFEVDEKTPVDEWSINYLGHYALASGGGSDVGDWAAGYGHKLGTQTLDMLPDKGLYVKRVWECMQANNRVDLCSEKCWGIGERLDQVKYFRECAEERGDDGAVEAYDAEIASLNDDAIKAKTKLEEASREHEQVYGKDPTFEVIDS